MKRNELIDRIIALAEDKGWNVTVEQNCGKSKSLDFDFAQYTDMGQDFSFHADMDDYDIHNLIENINDYYEDYDPDEEAMLWVGPDGHGRNGAPYRLSDIIKDMEQAEAMVRELLDTLIDANKKEQLWDIDEEMEENDENI